MRVQITIHIRVVLIIGFRFDIRDFGYYNEFGSEYPWAIGSIVIGIRIEIEILIQISALVALVLPGGALRILFYFNLTIDIDFTISTDGHTLSFDLHFKYRVDYTRIGPQKNLLFPCDVRFQLAEDNGQTTFTDNIGAQQSFYFVGAAGECCVPWEFDLRLVRFAPDGPDEAVQEGFRAEYCLNAAPNPDLRDVIITSEPPPVGAPPTLELDIGETATIKALARPVDEVGNQVESIIANFEWPSRGLDSNGRIVFDGISASERKAIVTGFDPFGLSSDIRRSNPSGLIALELYNKPVGSSRTARVRTAIFPVRYKEFDAGLIETAVGFSLGAIVML